MENVSVVIAAGGRGTRMGYNKNKVLMPLLGEAVILHTIRAFSKNPYIDEIIIVVGKDEYMEFSNLTKDIPKMCAVTIGGATRQESVYNGLTFTSGDIILIHDGARALIGQDEITAVIDAASEFGSAAVGVPCKDTLKAVNDSGFITGTIDRDKTFQIQTPQAFLREVILPAHEKAKADNFTATDDCALVEYYGGRIKIVHGKYDNIKLTTPDDIEIAEKILKRRTNI